MVAMAVVLGLVWLKVRHPKRHCEAGSIALHNVNDDVETATTGQSLATSPVSAECSATRVASKQSRRHPSFAHHAVSACDFTLLPGYWQILPSDAHLSLPLTEYASTNPSSALPTTTLSSLTSDNYRTVHER
jgi:hypothetical protein